MDHASKGARADGRSSDNRPRKQTTPPVLSQYLAQQVATLFPEKNASQHVAQQASPNNVPQHVMSAHLLEVFIVKPFGVSVGKTAEQK